MSLLPHITGTDCKKRNTQLKKAWVVGYLLFRIMLACLVAQLCPTICDSMDCSPPGSSLWGFSRQEYWSGLPGPPSGDLPNPGTESASSVSPGLQADSLPPEPSGKPKTTNRFGVGHLSGAGNISFFASSSECWLVSSDISSQGWKMAAPRIITSTKSFQRSEGERSLCGSLKEQGNLS